MSGATATLEKISDTGSNPENIKTIQIENSLLKNPKVARFAEDLLSQIRKERISNIGVQPQNVFGFTMLELKRGISPTEINNTFQGVSASAKIPCDQGPGRVAQPVLERFSNTGMRVTLQSYNLNT